MLLILLTILLFCCIFSIFIYKHYTRHISKFRNTNSINKYIELYSKYGKPNFIMNVPKGYVVWISANDCIFNNIILRDEPVLNDKKCLYLSIGLNNFNEVFFGEKIYYMNEISKYLYYDNVNEELYIKCSSIKNGLSILLSFLMFLYNNINIYEAKKNYHKYKNEKLCVINGLLKNYLEKIKKKQSQLQTLIQHHINNLFMDELNNILLQILIDINNHTTTPTPTSSTLPTTSSTTSSTTSAR